MGNKFYLAINRLKLLVVILLTFAANNVLSQDIGILSSSNPNSGCELANNELVTVIIFNFGANYSGSFDVSYEINGGAPVTETITLSPFPATSSFTYTFTAPADLSTANTYNFDFYTTLIGDVNNSNDTLSNISVVSDTLTIGGAILTSQSVCVGNNNGTLNLNASIGSVQFWESSINAGASWNNIVNTTTSENYNNITQETWYRAVLINGFCPQDTSSVAVLSIDSLSVGGSIAGSATICVPPNNGALTLSGETGTILDWEFSSNGGGSWNSLSNTTNSYNYINQPSTYLYRALVKNGNCSTQFSDTALVTVLLGAVGGILSPSNQSVCIGINSGNIVLSGESGTIASWESSIDGGASWTPIVNTTNTQSFLNLTQETWYRAMVSDCNIDTSAIAIIMIDSLTNPGTLFVDDTVCYLSSGMNYLNGHQGGIVDWEESTDGGANWNSIGVFTDTLNYSSLANQTMYRSVIKNGTCPADTSNIITIDIFPFNVGTSNDTLIELGESATISAFGGLFYTWSPTTGLNSPNSDVTIATPTTNTNYTVTIVDSNGCVYQENVLVDVFLPITDIVIADLISANGDGFNDTWNIIGIESHPNTKVMVFNSSGNIVFESMDYKNDWEGTFGGKQLPDGTYYYVVEVETESEIRKGFITIASK